MIMEDHSANATKTQPKKNRWSAFTTKSGRPPRASAETLPPPYSRYAWVSDSEMAGNDRALGHESEKPTLMNHRFVVRRGGWGRLVILLLLSLVALIALAVGLGVGLSRRRDSSSSHNASAVGNSDGVPGTAAQALPLGEYSITTALVAAQTNCTSNPATWRCYPYSIYSATSPSSSASTFNWVLTNTSIHYITNTSLPTTSATGIAANISISSSTNPFSLSFSSEPLTYINNASNPHYTFSFTQAKTVIPTTALTDDNAASTCFFNATRVTGVLYLSSASTSSSSSSDALPARNYTQDASAEGYTPWPYAAEVMQVSHGGADTPACYETVDGVVGARITQGFTDQLADEVCVCDYRNYV